MKICSKCSQTYSDDTLNFCLEDGALLSRFDRKTPDEEVQTVVHQKDLETQKDHAPRTLADTSKTGKGLKTIVITFVFGLFLVLISALAIGVYQFRDTFRSLLNPGPTPSEGQTPVGSADDEKAALTAVLKDAERALLKQDINALSETLADEYIEEDSNGQKTSKLQILIGLPFIERSSVEHTIENIKINGNKATVTGTGITKVKIGGEETIYRYDFETDFKKRDGRWQATYAYIEYLE